MTRFSALSLFAKALGGHKAWPEQWPDAAPKPAYDAIIVDGAIECVPEAFCIQLVEGGRLATGLFDAGVTRLAVARRAGDSLVPVPFTDIQAVPLPGFEKPRVFAF